MSFTVIRFRSDEVCLRLNSNPSRRVSSRLNSNFEHVIHYAITETIQYRLSNTIQLVHFVPLWWLISDSATEKRRQLNPVSKQRFS